MLRTLNTTRRLWRRTLLTKRRLISRRLIWRPQTLSDWAWRSTSRCSATKYDLWRSENNFRFWTTPQKRAIWPNKLSMTPSQISNTSKKISTKMQRLSCSWLGIILLSGQAKWTRMAMTNDLKLINLEFYIFIIKFLFEFHFRTFFILKCFR
jgi:hypothetical protein